ncbi:MAG TPA: hypothetical protein VGF53_08885 [Pseudolabrys sp.]|jgi:hypothetical protein
MTDVEFCILVEAGALERQALLLCESIRHFAGAYANARLTAVSPRPARRPGEDTVRRLREFGANYVPLNLVSPAPEYGPSHKTLALGWCARQSGPEVLVQIDSDTVFLDAPSFELNGHAALGRPVDVKGMCSTGPGDRFEPLWQRMGKICGVDVDGLGYVNSTVDKQAVRASFNGGLIPARRHVFEMSERCFLDIVADGIQSYSDANLEIEAGSGLVSPTGWKLWGLTQAALSLAVAKLGGTIGLLDDGSNVPLHMVEQLDPPPSRFLHVHYHSMFAGDDRIGPALERLALPLEQDAWLRRRLPLASR